MFELSDKLPEQLSAQAANALHHLVEKTTEKVTDWAKQLMSKIAKKAVDWISNTIKKGVDTLANQIKIALQPEQLIDTPLTKPTISGVESLTVTSNVVSGKPLAQKKQEQLASNLQPLVTEFANQWIAQLAAYPGQHADSFATLNLTPYQQPVNPLPLVSAAA